MLGIPQSVRRPAKRRKPDGSSFLWVASPDEHHVNEWVLRGFIEFGNFVSYNRNSPSACEKRLIDKLKVDWQHQSPDNYKFPIAINVLSSALLSQPFIVNLPARASQPRLPQGCHQQVSNSAVAAITGTLATVREMLGPGCLDWPVWKCKHWPDEVQRL
jgi:hypothetical protein